MFCNIKPSLENYNLNVFVSPLNSCATSGPASFLQRKSHSHLFLCFGNSEIYCQNIVVFHGLCQNELSCWKMMQCHFLNSQIGPLDAGVGSGCHYYRFISKKICTDALASLMCTPEAFSFKTICACK